jgi:hypothetical protein
LKGGLSCGGLVPFNKPPRSPPPALPPAARHAGKMMADMADMAVHGLHVAGFLFFSLFVVWITLFCFGIVAMGKLGIRNTRLV